MLRLKRTIRLIAVFALLCMMLSGCNQLTGSLGLSVPEVTLPELDVSIQAQILNLLMDLQDQMGMSYLFISHDLSVVKHISHDIAVMYLGQCVESGTTEEIFKHPAHPYTRALLASIPTPSLATREKEPQIIRGEVVSPINPAPGCRFAARCPYATDKCREVQQEREIREGHFVMCCRAEELAE